MWIFINENLFYNWLSHYTVHVDFTSHLSVFNEFHRTEWLSIYNFTYITSFTERLPFEFVHAWSLALYMSLSFFIFSTLLRNKSYSLVSQFSIPAQPRQRIHPTIDVFICWSVVPMHQEVNSLGLFCHCKDLSMVRLYINTSRDPSRLTSIVIIC